MKLESSTTRLTLLKKFEEGVEANKSQFNEFVSIEVLESQLVYLEERIESDIKEQIN